jgi:hypothetical protein
MRDEMFYRYQEFRIDDGIRMATMLQDRLKNDRGILAWYTACNQRLICRGYTRTYSECATFAARVQLCSHLLEFYEPSRIR